MRIIYGLFFIILLAFGVTFAILNGNQVALDYFWGSLELPLSVLLVVVFILGVVTGLCVGRSKRKTKKCGKSLAWFLALILIIAGFIFYYIVYNNHFFTVLPGQAYRSGQLSTQDFQDAIKQHQIKSIINLRGNGGDNAWYLDEMAASQGAGIKHYDINLPAHALPEPAELKKLVDVLQAAPRPLLMHCRRGIDRTGFASAVFLILNDQASLPKAEAQYSYRYLRFNLTSTGPLVMHYYEAWLKQNNLTSSRDNFITWVNLVAAKNSYDLSAQS